MEGKPEFKPGNHFKEVLLLVFIGVGFYVGLSNLTEVTGAVWAVIRLFTPLFVGGVIAFILNVPMHFFEQLCDDCYRKKG